MQARTHARVEAGARVDQELAFVSFANLPSEDANRIGCVGGHQLVKLHRPINDS